MGLRLGLGLELGLGLGLGLGKGIAGLAGAALRARGWLVASGVTWLSPL